MHFQPRVNTSDRPSSWGFLPPHKGGHDPTTPHDTFTLKSRRHRHTIRNRQIEMATISQNSKPRPSATSSGDAMKPTHTTVTSPHVFTATYSVTNVNTPPQQHGETKQHTGKPGKPPRTTTTRKQKSAPILMSVSLPPRNSPLPNVCGKGPPVSCRGLISRQWGGELTGGLN